MAADDVEAELARIAEDFKEGLVNRVKALQRSPDKQQSWYTHCRNRGITSYDPRSHTEQSLQAFLAANEHSNEPATSSSATSGGRWVTKVEKKPSESKTALVQRVKDLQRQSPENKTAWYKFCATQRTTNYDPARHEESVLRQFINSLPETSGTGGSGAADGGSGGRQAAFIGPSCESGKDGWFSGCKVKGKGKGKSADSDGWDGSSGGSDGAWDSWSSAPASSSLFGDWGCKGSDASWDNSWDWGWGDGWDCPPPMMMMMTMMKAKGKGMMAPGFAGACSAGDWMGKGAGADWLGKGCAAMGCTGKAAPMLLDGSGKGGKGDEKSEFGIMDVPLSAEKLNLKRGASSISVVPMSGLMDEEQAKQFQQALKRPRA
eukprot:TRINITY_DN510_c0_g1_i1.p1 TRINITY_DN510_c0_g1~~TRINITY_DN510_c0_g1_i1.p1  ORF type:complete len:398 (+),score=92.21 TRINITY_DN510_c0_g1_i1:70-1194(+)